LCDTKAWAFAWSSCKKKLVLARLEINVYDHLLWRWRHRFDESRSHSS